MLPTILFLNYDAEKTRFDRIAIHKEDDEFYAYYKEDVDNKTKLTKKTQGVVYDQDDLLDYLSDILDLVANDLDRNTFHNIDVLVPGYPIVSLHPQDEKTRDLIVRIVDRWSSY